MANSARKKQQQLMVLIGVVALALVSVGIVIALNQSNAGSTLTINENETYAGIPIGGRYAAVRQVERGSDVAAGVERGFDENGVPFIGRADAPIVIAEIMDFTCPHCASYSETLDQIVLEYVRSGQARLELYILPAEVRAPASRYAARGALCAETQGGFWEMHDELLRITRSESTDQFNLDGMAAIATDIGLDGAALRACMQTNEVDAGLLAASRLAATVATDSTPTLVYRLRGSETWQPFHRGADGSIGGGIALDEVASVIASANTGE